MTLVPGDMREVAAVVVTYNRRPLLDDCLRAIETQTHRPDLVIVIDNASSDDTADYLSQREWRVPHRVHRLRRNYGGALGFAVGIRAAVAAGAQSVWLMDDDAMATPSALEYLLEDTKIATRGGRRPSFACSLVVWKDGSVARMNIPRAHALWNESAARLGRPIIDVDSSSFVSVLIPTEHIRGVGLPHIGYFKWYDDTEYTLRLRGTYGPGICSVNSVVKHLPAHNDGALPWLATDDDLADQVRGLRNRVSASLSVKDVRGFLAASRDTAMAVTSPNQPPGHRLALLRGYLSGYAYRPPVLPVDD
jgi:GT2 family glycosyltransferase